LAYPDRGQPKKPFANGGLAKPAIPITPFADGGRGKVGTAWHHPALLAQRHTAPSGHDILEWAASQGRVLLSHDVSTVPPAAYQRIAEGKPMPGAFIVPDRMPLGQAIKEILFLSLDIEPGEWKDQVLFLPVKRSVIITMVSLASLAGAVWMSKRPGRMQVGKTPQLRIKPACAGAAWRGNNHDGPFGILSYGKVI
jgi:hypothetical protein